MPEENGKKNILQTPLWFLQLDSKFMKYSMRWLYLFFAAIFAIYMLLPIFSPEYKINIIDVYPYYIIFYIILIIVSVIFRKYFIKPYELTQPEIFAYRFMRVGLNLRKIILDNKLKTNLKKNIKILKKTIIQVKKDFNPSKDHVIISSLDSSIKTLDKINAYSEDKVYRQLLSSNLDGIVYCLSETIFFIKKS